MEEPGTLVAVVSWGKSLHPTGIQSLNPYPIAPPRL